MSKFGRVFFYDTEFMEEPGFLHLISIGVVGEDGSEYYAINSEADFSRANSWVRDNVLPKLDMSKAIPLIDIRKELLDFLSPSSESPVSMVGYYADYDHVLLSWIFGKMVDLPEGMPMFTWDLVQMALQCGVDKKLFPEQNKDGEHNALMDARWNRDLFFFLLNYK